MGLSITHYYQKEIQAMAHCNTIFHQMLKFIPRHQFEALESHHSTGRKSRTFSRWNQFVHLMFMQLTGRVSLRDGIQSMISRALNLYHVGAKPVSRSTLPMPTTGVLPPFTKRYSKRFTNIAACYLQSTSSNSKTSFTVWMPRSLI